MWRISESGKEYVFTCLDDFRKYCRNSHFHKENINVYDYDTVKRIRNNAHVCLYGIDNLSDFSFDGDVFLKDYTCPQCEAEIEEEYELEQEEGF